MTLVKRDDGSFTGDFRRKGMQRLHLSLRTSTKSEAKARHDAVQKLVRQGRDEMIDQLRAGLLTVERVQAMVEHHEPLTPVVGVQGTVLCWDTVDETIARYLDYLRRHPNRAEGTWDNARWNLKSFPEFMYEGRRTGDRSLDDVPRGLIQAFQTSYVDAGRSPNTITNTMARVSAIWRWAASEEAKDAAEARRAARPLYSPIEKDKIYRKWRPKERFLSLAEMDSLVAATPEPLLFAICAGLLMGLRQGELLHLRPHLDVDLEVGSIDISAHDGWAPKTKRSTRTLPMTPQMHAIAARHIARWASPHLMYSGRDPRRPMLPEILQRHFKKIGAVAGLTMGRDEPGGVTFHTLRHTFASHSVMQGTGIFEVAQLLGDKVETVEDNYLHLSPDHKRAALARMAAVVRLPEQLQIVA